MKKTIVNLEGYKIEEVKTTYNKKGSKWVEVEQEINIINSNNYNSIINSKSFFTNLGGIERHTKSYTVAGYIITTVNSISPDKQIKIVRQYDIKSK